MEWVLVAKRSFVRFTEGGSKILRIREHLTTVNAEVTPRRKLRLVSPVRSNAMDRPASFGMNNHEHDRRDHDS